MTRRPFLLGILLLTTLLPLALPGATAWTCLPSSDRSAGVLGLGAETYYVKVSQSGSLTQAELWQETNDEPGLQTSSGMSCVGKADKLLRTGCFGCPIRL